MKEKILAAAVAEAEALGRYDRITRGPVAVRASCAVGMINKHFGTMPGLQSAVLTVFIEREDLPQIAWGLANRAPEVQNIDQQLKARALNTLAA